MKIFIFLNEQEDVNQAKKAVEFAGHEAVVVEDMIYDSFSKIIDLKRQGCSVGVIMSNPITFKNYYESGVLPGESFCNLGIPYCRKDHEHDNRYDYLGFSDLWVKNNKGKLIGVTRLGGWFEAVQYLAGRW